MKLPESARRVRALATPERRRWFEIRNAAEEDTGPVEVLIYDEIDPFWGVSAAVFVRDLAQIDAERDLTVRINSPGGDVYEGIAILNALRGRAGKVTTVIDGLAASIASVIAMAGTEIVMMPNSEMMVHDPWMLTIGDAEDMQTAADNLGRIADNLASIYAERTGGTAEEWRAIMRAETWYTAAEAVEAGLANRVEEVATPTGDDRSERAAARFDLSVFNFKHAGRADAPAPAALATNRTSAAEAEVPTGKEATMATLKEGLAERLGTTADADDETMLTALDEALAERATPEAPAPEQQAAAKLPDGVVAIDAATLTELQAAARRGDEARANQERAERISAVDRAVATGRITPAQKANWLDRLEKDPSEKAVLDSLAPVYPVAELGHAIGTEYTTEPDAYEAIYGKEG
ncbi:head maturation protease, ClpP-related [Gordonia rubripertincta]|uniref:head maturation protease, ClpP-related n=1 Tax=Gordonia rubripertincta TaxID=36822 RepID=UPI0015FD4054|nr:head maturation protease, ClpP-related [Gordonia rubripertincta]QMU22511.1 ATP-dependent Clp protease proteolytic subunit [Gordonia rubripertincta]